MFFDLPDPRARNCRHRLGDLVLIAVAAALCGATTSAGYAQFALSKRVFLEGLIGDFTPPSHDTFSRVFSLLDPVCFAQAFADFAHKFAGELNGVVAIDGKAMRRAYVAGAQAWPPMTVTAWAVEARQVLGAFATGPAGSGEGEAETALRLIAMLDLTGATVTADALHCNRRMAKAVLARGGDYALALKGNQSGLKKAVLEVLETPGTCNDTCETREVSHGRHEVRTARVASAGTLATDQRFEGLNMLAAVTSQRGDSAPHTRLYVLSKTMTAAEALQVTRDHWAIENTLHWSLDVTFNEDQIRSRTGNAPANLALVTRLALTLLKRIEDPKASIQTKIYKCSWEEPYLIKALSHMR